MADDTIVLGSAFSDWAQLTEEYKHGLEALRRGERGASSRMSEIARLMNQYAVLVGHQGIPAIQVSHEPAASGSRMHDGWLAKAMRLLPAREWWMAPVC